MKCKYCNSENTEFWDCGRVKGKYWEAYRCNDCGEITSDEPQEE